MQSRVHTFMLVHKVWSVKEQRNLTVDKNS